MKNPLVRNGTSQKERLLKALVPSYIKIDEKTIEDMVAFAYKYADLIKYYDNDNQSREDWQALFEISITVLLAIISVAPYKTVEEKIRTLQNEFSDSPTSGKLQSITDEIFKIVKEIQYWNLKISPTHRLKSFIVSEIENQLQNHLSSLAQIDKSISPVNDYKEFYTTDWKFDETAFQDLTPSIIHNVDDLKSMYDDLTIVYKSFFQTYVKIIQKAQEYFQSNIIEEDDHKPHITLFLSFLYLFQYAKDYSNGLTKRHLDFYYHDVLRLERKDQVPDKVHVIFELTKNITSHSLKENILLNAGKDDTGKALSYELTEEIVVSKATVDQLKTVRLIPDKNYKIYAAIKADSADGKGKEFGEDSDGNWKPFGSTEVTEAKVGIAVSSPVLLLKEGKRTITITLNMADAVILSSAQNSFKIQLSTDDDWLDISEYGAGADKDEQSGFDVEIINTEISNGAIKFVIRLHSGDPAIVPYDCEILDGNFETTWPMVKIYLNEATDKSVYGYVKDLKIQAIDLDVDCQGIRDLIIQNDQTVFTPDNAFQPFGARPSIGSNFYIGNEEAFSKELSDLSLVVEWLDMPPSGDFEKHYCVYNSLLNEKIKNDSFKVKISYLENKIWNPLFDGKGQNLFTSPADDFYFVYQILKGDEKFAFQKYPAQSQEYIIKKQEKSVKESEKKGDISGLEKKPVKIVLSKGSTDPAYLACKSDESTEDISSDMINVSTIDFTGSDIDSFHRYKGILEFESYNSTTQQGFLRLQLAGKDFQHTKYSEVYTKQALKLATGKTDETTTVFPNEPYTPTVKSIYLNYASSVKIDFTKDNSEIDFHSRIERVFHIYPFGQKELHPYLAGEAMWVFPQFTLDITTCTGHLYIGLKDALPSQILSLLFQVYEGSGDPEKEIPEINWHYLKGNTWQSFADADILSDTTNGLVKSGIIKFLLPADITSDSTLLEKSHLWIRGTVKETEHVDALPDLIDVRAQAVMSSFKDNDNSVTHLESVLPAGTIKKLLQRNAAIKSVSQPYGSFGGRTQESDSDFYRRVSERLRHKNRAITIWDYERLVLQEFTAIRRVKCINHTNMKSEIAPGCVMVVVIPDLRNKNAVNLLEPKVDVGTLEDIRDFLAQKNTLFVKGGDKDISNLAQEKLKVVNPQYEQVKVAVKVKMNENYDPQYYKKVLNNDLKSFLAPWAYDEGSEISFGSSLHKSAILNFIEKREYVDFLTDLKLEHYKNGISLGFEDEIQTTSARSILTSYGTVDISTGIEHDITIDAGCTSS